MESLEKINKQTRTAYNKAAQKYYDLFFNELNEKPFDKEFINTYLSYLNPGSIICNTGCGPCGHIENYILQKGFEVTGIDISEKCIEIARMHYPEIKFEAGDFSEFRCSDNYYDGLIAYYSLVDTPKKFINTILQEFNRVLKKNGCMLLAVKEGRGEGYQKELLGIKTKVYFSFFTAAEIEKYLNSNGFEIIKMQKRKPYKNEIQVNRLFSISRKK